MEVLFLLMPDTTSETYLDTNTSFDKRKIVHYLEDRHVSDGGYFFAQVKPSSGLDTYLAVKTLNLLGAKIKYARSIHSFWEKENPDDLFGIFLTVESYRELGLPATTFNKYRRLLFDKLKDGDTLPRLISVSIKNTLRFKNISLAMDYIGTIGKDLQDIFHLVMLCRDLRIKLNNKEVISLVEALRNKNGGFGNQKTSHLLTTYHALSILNTLSHKSAAPDRIYIYLMDQWKKSEYLEDVFYVVESMAMLGRPLPQVNHVVQFIDSCQRNNGGFSRATVMGIPTIEDTYYAVKLLKTCEHFLHRVFLK